MSAYIIICVCAATTGIAIGSVYFASGARLQRRLLPWTAGVLLGVSVFWILPEIAGDRGWSIALGSVLPIVFLLAWIDRYVYPICPFCAGNLHSDSCEAIPAARFGRHPVRIGWPLLVVGAAHSFFDGWAIALGRTGWANSASVALSYGIIVHKIPESLAIGLLAARLTSGRTRALGVVAIIQAAMAAGCLFPIFSAYRNFASAQLLLIPACSCLLLFGVLALEDEWRLNGGPSAIRGAVPGLVGCGLASLATKMLFQ
jgi:zinc transporter ZupT